MRYKSKKKNNNKVKKCFKQFLSWVKSNLILLFNLIPLILHQKFRIKNSKYMNSNYSHFVRQMTKPMNKTLILNKGLKLMISILKICLNLLKKHRWNNFFKMRYKSKKNNNNKFKKNIKQFPGIISLNYKNM